jgi:hypothetical protein
LTPEQEFSWRKTHTPPLFNSIKDVLIELDVRAAVSFPVCEEIIIHHGRDIDRLYATHHQYVHPTKHCSYLAFWIRKLKPISDAYPLSAIEDPIPFSESITDINEKVALFIGLRSLCKYVRDGDITLPKMLSEEKRISIFTKLTEEYLDSSAEDGMSMGNRFVMLTYDMRFRTFGPHHLTHVFTQILREVALRV